MDAPPVQYARTSDGWSIACCVSGEGHPFVLIPEPLSHLHVAWSMPARSLLYKSLAERFKLIQYDERGEGMSQRDLPKSLSPDDFVLDVEAVVDRLELDRFILFSGIGKADRAVRYAVKHPERVAALLLWNPTAGDPGVTIRLYLDVAEHSWDLFVETVATNFGFDPPELEVRRIREATTQADFLRKVRAMEDHGVKHLLPQVSAPTLVMATRGRTVPVEDQAREVASLIPSAQLVLFETQGLHLSLYRSDGRLPPAIPVIDEFLAGHVLPGPGSLRAAATATTAGQDILSARELEVLRLLAAGRSNQQIADELVISLNTVRRHVSNIFDKTGTVNRAQAAVYARDHGLA
jgi:DNA-binding CsgD family transcriptional regulator/pimeloyl-ACP methyl ester carboxylesterase